MTYFLIYFHNLLKFNWCLLCFLVYIKDFRIRILCIKIQSNKIFKKSISIMFMNSFLKSKKKSNFTQIVLIL